MNILLTKLKVLTSRQQHKIESGERIDEMYKAKNVVKLS